MLVFSTQPPSLHPSLCQSKVYTDSVWLGEGGEALSPVGDHILLEFNTLYLTRFRTYKIARPPPQTKTQEGRGPRQKNTCRKVPLKVNFLDDDILLWCLNSQSMVKTLGKMTYETFNKRINHLRSDSTLCDCLFGENVTNISASPTLRSQPLLCELIANSRIGCEGQINLCG